MTRETPPTEGRDREAEANRPPSSFDGKPSGWEALSLRLRVFLFFALLMVAAVAVMAAAGVIVATAPAEDRLARLTLALAGGGFALVGLIAWVWLRFDENMVQPMERVARDIRTTLLTGAGKPIDGRDGRYLGLLAPTARAVQQALTDRQAKTDAAVATAVADSARQRRRLEAVLRDLHQGVIICTPLHEVLLYNRQALALLHDHGDLGLGRSAFDALAGETVRHAVDRLTRRLAEGRHQTHPDGLTLSLILHPARGEALLRGRIALTLDEAEATAVGYVVVFDDATREIEGGLARDRLLHGVVEEIRRSLATVGLGIDLLARRAGTAADGIAEPLALERDRLDAALTRLDEAASDVLAGAWPTGRMDATALAEAAAERLTEVGGTLGRPVAVTVESEGFWLHGDSASLLDLIERVGRGIVGGGADGLTVQAGQAGRRAYLDILWRGPPVANEALSAWLETPIGEARVTGRDILFRHQTDCWLDLARDGRVRFRLALSTDSQPTDRRTGTVPAIPARPEFYDFDLFDEPARHALDRTPLAKAAFVVFDTETTGLEPSRGDQLLSVAGVRILNGRLLRGETFDRLVNPGRRIPAASTRIHGITDADVATADPAERVLPAFHRFVGSAALVAHNAAFDMTFLTLKQDKAGVRFDQPVLDTVLLAAHLFGSHDSLTLDALADRFQVTIPEEARHTALGDSLATAEVLLSLIRLLADVGVHTIGDAQKVSAVQAGLRRQQSRY